MLQDVRRYGLGKSGLKFRHGVGGIKNGPKNSNFFMDDPFPILGSKTNKGDIRLYFKTYEKNC